MLHHDRDLDSICAAATPAGVGGISVLRVSGSETVSITRALCDFIPLKPESHKAYFGLIKSYDKKTAIDEVIVTYFAQGRSFTGEDNIEISCHGSPVIVREILAALTLAGARTADRGEFTYRAFMNGRIDLVQAESVLTLIESQSLQSAKQALRQLQGSVSQELTAIEDLMIWCLAHMEATIDFSTEGLEVVEEQLLLSQISELKRRLQKLLDTFSQGRILKEGFRLTLTGVPNVGKSSLLNLLTGEDRAIVTDIPGTTRDLIEATFVAGNLRVLVTDTAGLRQSQDQIEMMGIEKSYAAQRAADGIFFVFDSERGLQVEELQELAKLPLEKTFLIGNKSDRGGLPKDERKKQAQETLESTPLLQNLQGVVPYLKDKVFIVSALEENCGEELKECILRNVGEVQFEDQAVISQARHFENLTAALGNMMKAFELIQMKSSPEFMSLEMKEALLKVQETLGKRFDDQIMDRVFKEFCIGK